MKSKSKKRSWALFFTFVFITLVFALTSLAQRPAPGTWDTSINPHDFTNLYYAENGVIGRQISWRRNGHDGLSVYDKSAAPPFREIRVIVTVPAYNQTGEMYFWYPLGELTNADFTDDMIGFMAMQTAKLFPVYIFPDDKYLTYNSIANTRQAPLIDNSLPTYAATNPLGIREIFLVNYTEKVRTKEAFKMLMYMGEKNGYGTDNLPLIRSVDDLNMFLQDGLVALDYADSGKMPMKGHYAISPVLGDPTRGAIAPDAFLWMSTRDGNPLKSEMKFVEEFDCLQRTGDWCL